MKNNKVVLKSFFEGDFEEIKTMIASLNEKLVPYMEEISGKEKLRMAKLKNKRLPFVQKMYQHSLLNPYLVPGYLNSTDLKTEMEAADSVRHLMNHLNQLAQGLEDMHFLINSDMYSSALAMYGTLQIAADNNVQGAKVILEEMKVYFEKSGRKKSDSKPDQAL